MRSEREAVSIVNGSPEHVGNGILVLSQCLLEANKITPANGSKLGVTQ